MVLLEFMVPIWELPQTRVPDLWVLIISILLFRVLNKVPLIFETAIWGSACSWLKNLNPQP